MAAVERVKVLSHYSKIICEPFVDIYATDLALVTMSDMNETLFKTKLLANFEHFFQKS